MTTADSASSLVLGGIFLVLLLLALWASLRGVAPSRWQLSVSEADTWAAGRGLTLDDSSRPVVSARLGRNRLWRRIGFLVPLWVFVLPAAVAGFAVSQYRQWGYAHGAVPVPHFAGEGFLAAIAGYFLGAVLAEVLIRRPAPSGARAAVMGARVPAQYLPPYVRLLLVVLPAAVAVLHLLPVLMPPAETLSYSRPAGSLGDALLAGALATGLALGLMAAIRWLVARPQAVTSAQDAAVDDALRSSSVHIVAGAGCALLFTMLGGSLGTLQDIYGAYGWSILFWPASWACIIYGLVLWSRLASLPPWRVRRSQPATFSQAATGTPVTASAD